MEGEQRDLLHTDVAVRSSLREVCNGAPPLAQRFPGIAEAHGSGSLKEFMLRE